MEDADLITECNAGLKHALDVFGVQSGIIAAMTMAEMQKDATQRHEELIAILKEKRSRPKRSSTSGSDGSRPSSPRKKRPSGVKTDQTRSVSMLPASPKIFYGREEEVKHLTETIKRSMSDPARITICGAEGVGKTAVALATSHHSDVSQIFGIHRYFVECDGATDAKQLVAAIALHLNLESTGKKPVIRHLSTIATEETPVLLILDALDRAWKPHETRTDVEDFLSLLADLHHVTIMVTIRGGERPRQVRWTRPFLPTMSPLPSSAARDTFLDISDVSPDDPGLDELLAITENNPGTITHMAGLASFEGCVSLVARWQAEGSALLLDKAERMASPRRILSEGLLFEEPDEMHPGEERVPSAVAEKDILALLDCHTLEPMPTIDSLLSQTTLGGTFVDALLPRRSLLEGPQPMPSLDSLLSQSTRGGTSVDGLLPRSPLAEVTT
ncbi:hypothetical protein B0H17DRAFT_420287 [Mycena rosella]|uniref:Orc1-like AAA ATPase domain-containing protein n=1 Tax=Mycena rosella TaxID=1033263 RepID=A0AAD7G1P1_MYCRO|nr:hypothetical protein B0H17DRAFT_420287 [Mycena rosella]